MTNRMPPPPKFRSGAQRTTDLSSSGAALPFTGKPILHTNSPQSLNWKTADTQKARLTPGLPFPNNPNQHQGAGCPILTDSFTVG